MSSSQGSRLSISSHPLVEECQTKAYRKWWNAGFRSGRVNWPKVQEGFQLLKSSVAMRIASWATNGRGCLEFPYPASDKIGITQLIPSPRRAGWRLEVI